MSDYDCLISDAFESYTASAREEWESGEFDCLDIDIRRRVGMPEISTVEFLLTCGGPTVSVLIDENDHVYFNHSWGCNSIGEKMTQQQYSPECHEDAAFWLDLANEQREILDL